MGLFSRKPKLYDISLMTFISALADIDPEISKKVDQDWQRTGEKILLDHIEDIIRKHYYEDLRPPVKWNYNFVSFAIPRMPEGVLYANKFWDDKSRELVDRARFMSLCDALKTMWKEGLVKNYPDYDRNKLEDGFENVNYDYYPEEGVIMLSMLLPEILPL